MDFGFGKKLSLNHGVSKLTIKAIIFASSTAGAVKNLPVYLNSLDYNQQLLSGKIRFVSNDPEHSLLTIPVTLDVIDTIPPAPITDLNLRETNQDSVVLTWTAPGDNDDRGRAFSYEILISSAAKPETPPLYCLAKTPGEAGQLESFILCEQVLPEGGYIRVKTYDEIGQYSLSNTIHILTTDVTDNPEIQPTFFLAQNYPNPFNARTSIPFSLEKRELVTIEIFNQKGQHVARIWDKITEPGTHQAFWAGTNHSGIPVSSGLYVYRIQTPDHVESMRMLYIK